MPLQLAEALVAGLWATTLFTGFLTLALALGWLHLDFGRLLGGILRLTGPTQVAVGLGLHFLVGLGFGMIYALIFALIQLPAVPWLMGLVGVGFGIYHWILSMPLISIGRALNPRIRRGEEADPGTWGIAFGPQEAALRLLGHLLYGGSFGVAYGTLALLEEGGSTPLIRGLSLLLAAILAGVVIYLYTTWLDAAGREHDYVFSAATPAPDEQREAARTELLRRYQRGEISWDEYQHRRREFASEP